MNNLITLITVCLIGSVIAQGGSCRASHAGSGSSKTNAEMKTPTRNDKLPAGVWGGEHVQAEVTERGAEFEFDCAHGAITQTIVLDGSGKFDLPGKFAAEHPGPTRDEESTNRSVRYSGSVQDVELTLTVTDTTTKEVLGTFTLRHGSEGRIRKCR